MSFSGDFSKYILKGGNKCPLKLIFPFTMLFLAHLSGLNIATSPPSVTIGDPSFSFGTHKMLSNGSTILEISSCHMLYFPGFLFSLHSHMPDITAFIFSELHPHVKLSPSSFFSSFLLLFSCLFPL